MNEGKLKEQIKNEIKQEMKKTTQKNFIILVFVIIVIVGGIFAFRKIGNNIEEKQLEKQIISREEFETYITEVPITTENWKNYFTLENKNNELHLIVNQSNMFGYLELCFKIDSDFTEEIFNYEDFPCVNPIRKQDNTLNIVGLKENVEITIDDLECSEIRGSFYKIDLPEELWQTDDTGSQYIKVGTKDKFRTLEKENYLEKLGFLLEENIPF